MSDSNQDTAMSNNDPMELMRLMLERLESMGNGAKETMSRIEALENRLQPSSATPTSTLEPESANPHNKPPTSKPRHSLPHPPTFSGNKVQWRGWKLEMEGKIDEDAEAIGSLKAQFRYIYTRLEGAARTNVTTYYEMETAKEFPDPRGLLNRLELLYGERNRKEKAIQNLHSIRQKDDETFISFYPRFEKEMANADTENWPDDVKISYLRNALNSKMKDRLVGTSGIKTATYAGFAQKCVDLSNDMDLFGQWTKKGGNNRNHTAENTQIPLVLPTPSQSMSAPINREDMMEWEPTPLASTQLNTIRSRSRANMNGYPSKRPEDQQLIGKRAKWVDQEELDARRHDRRCLRCGRSTCRIALCPLAAAIRPTRTNIQVASTAVVMDAAVKDTEEMEEGQ